MKIPTFAHDLHFGRIHTLFDHNFDLTCILAIHSTALGPAIGGCRCIVYDSYEAGVIDALKLAHAMSMKAAIHGLPHGGAKMVVLKPHSHVRRKQFFEKIGAFIDTFQGAYITAIDSGTDEHDMQSIANATPYVFSDKHFVKADSPALFTAQGVLRSIEGAIMQCYDTDVLTNKTFTLQGLGNVGQKVASLLMARGARLIVTDIDVDHAQAMAKTLDAKYVPPDAIYEQNCDVFVPCALGGVINPSTLSNIRAKIVVGSANNMFADVARDAKEAHARGILCVPDFIANGGGLMHVSGIVRNESSTDTFARVDGIRDTVNQVLNQALKQNRCPTEVALHLATQRIEVASNG